MTEYLAATALIGIAAIGTLGFMGDTLQSQFTAMTHELAGQDGSQANGRAVSISTTNINPTEVSQFLKRWNPYV